MSKLSIVVATFNNDSELRSTMASIPASLNAVVLIINGGKVIYQASEFPDLNVRVFNEPDKGISDAWNKGALKSETPYFFYLNSGDLLNRPDYLKRACQFLDQNPDMDIVHGNQIFEDQIAGPIIQRHRKQSVGRGMPFLILTTVFRKSSFIKAGIFDLSYKIAMDFEWALRAQKMGLKDHYLNDEVIHMDGKGVSSTQEWRGIMECKRAIQTYLPFSPLVWGAFSVRVFFYSLRRMMLRFGFKDLLATLKRLKHR